MFDRRSALESTFAGTLSRDAPTGARLKIGEFRGWSLVQLAAFAATLEQLQNAVRPILGVDLPRRIGVATEAGERHILKTGPEQFWILGPGNDDLPRRLQGLVAAEVGAVTSLSHSRTRLFIEGPDAREVLARGIPVDFRPEGFGIGQFVMTGVHHTPVLVHRIAAERYDIYAMRTFALSVWEWLADAALPFGYEIVAPAA